MNVILLMSESPWTIYAANKLYKRFGLKAVLIPQEEKKQQIKISFFRRTMIYYKLYGIKWMLNRVFSKKARKVLSLNYLQDYSLRKAFGQTSQKLNEKLNVIKTPSVKSKETENIIRNLKPDVIILFGTKIVPNQVLKIAKKKCLNIHLGLSPRYRGWGNIIGLSNIGISEIGVTIHEPIAKADAGPIFGRMKIEVEPDDVFSTTYFKAVRIGVELLIKALDNLEKETYKVFEQNLDEGKVYSGAWLKKRPEVYLRAMKNFQRDLKLLENGKFSYSQNTLKDIINGEVIN